MSAKYERLKGVANDVYNDKGMCTVIALAVACDVSYGKAHAALRRAGRKHRCAASIYQMISAASELGFAMLSQKVSPKAKTMVSVIDTLDPEHTTIVATTRHVAAVVNGAAHDWSQGRRKRVLGVYRITPTPTTAEI